MHCRLSRISLATECFLKPLDTIARIRTTLYLQSKCCKDLSVTERMFQLSTTENKYQFDEEQNRENTKTETVNTISKKQIRNTISEGEERQEDDCGLLSLFEDL